MPSCLLKSTGVAPTCCFPKSFGVACHSTAFRLQNIPNEVTMSYCSSDSSDSSTVGVNLAAGLEMILPAVLSECESSFRYANVRRLCAFVFDGRADLSVDCCCGCRPEACSQAVLNDFLCNVVVMKWCGRFTKHFFNGVSLCHVLQSHTPGLMFTPRPVPSYNCGRRSRSCSREPASPALRAALSECNRDRNRLRDRGDRG